MMAKKGIDFAELFGALEKSRSKEGFELLTGCPQRQDAFRSRFVSYPA